MRLALRSHWPEGLWFFWVLVNLAAMFVFLEWQTVPFHFIWVSLALVFGMRLWGVGSTLTAGAVVTVTTGAALAVAAVRDPAGAAELAEVPLMATMFLAMVWHVRRRQAAMDGVRRAAVREREFLRDASHELRTPITIARGHAELVLASSTGRTREDADIVLDELARLARISDQLLLLAAAEHASFLRRTPVDLERLVTETARRWAPTASRGWRVETVEGTVLADRERLACALDALIENAVKFTSEDDRISITTRADGETAVIEIADTGRGIPKEHIGRVFDRFWRGDNDQVGHQRGTGIGLATVKAIAEAHGSTVSVASDSGEGTTFAIRLGDFQPA